MFKINELEIINLFIEVNIYGSMFPLYEVFRIAGNMTVCQGYFRHTVIMSMRESVDFIRPVIECDIGRSVIEHFHGKEEAVDLYFGIFR